MAFESRGNHRYYYQALRVGGRVRKIYLTGLAADVTARLVEDGHQHRRRCRKAEARLAEISEIMDRYETYADRLTSLAFTAHHYHRRRGEWRLQNDR